MSKEEEKRKEFFVSLGQELDALKGRVRELRSDPHWLTDGEWKESVLRNVLRRYLPRTIDVSRGFVTTGTRESHQIDIILHYSDRPTLFREGDLVFVTPDAVAGLIEVKSRVDASVAATAIHKLCGDVGWIRREFPGPCFAALFAYDASPLDSQKLLTSMASAAPTWNHRLDFAALGADYFARYWNLDPETGRKEWARWHTYEMPAMAAGYFISNVIEAVSPGSVSRNTRAWFPAGGKEAYRTGVGEPVWPKSGQD